MIIDVKSPNLASSVFVFDASGKLQYIAKEYERKRFSSHFPLHKLSKLALFSALARKKIIQRQILLSKNGLF